MSPNTAMWAQRLRNVSTFVPCFDLSFGKASSDAGGRAIFLTTSLHQLSSVTVYWQPHLTRLLCLLHNTYMVGIIQSVFQWLKKSIILTSTPSPTLPTRRAPGRFCIHLASPNYSSCVCYNFIFRLICLKFSHKFLHTYSVIIAKYNEA